MNKKTLEASAILLAFIGCLPVLSLHYLSYWLSHSMADELSEIPVRSILGISGIALIVFITYLTWKLTDFILSKSYLLYSKAKQK